MTIIKDDEPHAIPGPQTIPTKLIIRHSCGAKPR